MKLNFRRVLLFLIGLIGLGLLISADAAHAQTPNLEIYVANYSNQCTGRQQCFFNDDPDTINAIALNKAIAFAKQNNLENANINILAAYEIRTDQITVDYPVNIIGQNGGSFSTSSTNCTQPMLLITSRVTLRKLNITDGYCTSPSRDLIHINSPFQVTIEQSTLHTAANAIVHKNSLGSLTVRFNDIKNNSGFALKSENTEVTSRLLLVANNIENNGGQTQVICQNNSSVNHNYWGENVLPSLASQGCSPDNLKVLGARILPIDPGVAATLLTLTSNYPTNDFYGLSGKSSQQTGIYAVNHSANKPFPDRSARQITVCGNYFDVFLAENAQNQPITLRFKYDQNTACQQAVQTMSLCGSGDQKTYPLMWLDPKTGVTNGWDNAGASPQANSIFGGQEVRCDFQSKTLEVILDTDGRPNLQNDLQYTPFVVGFEISTITTFRPTETSPGTVTISWSTNSEDNTVAFRVLRSLTENSGYTQIGANVPASGSSLSGRSYELKDTDISASTVYYYKLEVLEANADIQQTIGPVWVSTHQGTVTSQPTSTRIPTQTPTQFQTATNAFRSATPTFFTHTPDPTEEFIITSTTTLEDFTKPTSIQSTRTLRPTLHPGQLLEKRDNNFVSTGFLISIIAIPIIAFSFWIFSKNKKKKH